MDLTLYKWAKMIVGCVAGISGAGHFVHVFCPAKDDFERNVPHGAEWFSGASPSKIPGTVPFHVTTNVIMKYNLLACKVLTELVLAHANRH